MKKTFFLLAAVTLIGLSFWTSCKNEVGPGVAEVTVLDDQGVTQSGVKVVMYCTQPDCVVRREGVTNTVGMYSQEFELPAVLRVRAVRYDTTYETTGLPPNEIVVTLVDSICGDGFVQIENDEVTSETITILECI